ncbi:MAG: hypothetical protein IIY73_05085 [Solobacterium sp.]|nr:hypothetical protein [Solobacterium sp.]
MKKLMKLMLAAGIAVSLAACSGSSDTPKDTDNEREEITEVEEVEEVVVTAEDVEKALQGTWDMPDGSGTLAFDNGTFAVLTGGQTLNGEYTIDMEEMVIAGRIKTSDGTLSIKTPFVYEEGTLKIFNNKNVELIKRN